MPTIGHRRPVAPNGVMRFRHTGTYCDEEPSRRLRENNGRPGELFFSFLFGEFEANDVALDLCCQGEREGRVRSGSQERRCCDENIDAGYMRRC